MQKYANLNEQQKNFVDLIEGFDNGKGIRSFHATMSFDVKNDETGSITTDIQNVRYTDEDIRHLRRAYRGGIGVLIRTGEEILSKKFETIIKERKEAGFSLMTTKDVSYQRLEETEYTFLEA